MSGPRVLGIDPGFRLLGLAVVELGADPSADRVVHMDVLRTEKSKRKRGVRAADDDMRRSLELAERLTLLGQRFMPAAICAESASWPRSSKVCAQLGRAWGLVAMLAMQRGCPVLQATPMDLKKAITGSGTASKSEVQDALREAHGPLGAALLAFEGAHPKGRWEHGYDALGAVHACREANEIKVLRQLARREGGGM